MLRRAGRALPLLALVLAGCWGVGDSGEQPGTPAARAPADRWPAPERYALDLAYDADRFALAGDQRIAFRNTGREPLESVWLRTLGQRVRRLRPPLRPRRCGRRRARRGGARGVHGARGAARGAAAARRARRAG